MSRDIPIASTWGLSNLLELERTKLGQHRFSPPRLSQEFYPVSPPRPDPTNERRDH